MSSVDELVAFVRRCLDEEERVIQRNCGQQGLSDDGDFPDYRTYTDADTAAADDYLHAFRPPRMLAEVKAKRERLLCIESDLADDESDETAQWLARVEALPFAGQDGWREEWRVEGWRA